jgi:serine/threonine protein kinase/cephalosporin-C deacetylase-like acetyl esterase
MKEAEIAMSGESLGRFEINEKLGEGGMGVLYRARDTRLGRTVAIKFLRHDALNDPHRAQRLIQEARAASALNHPNIVTVHDIGEDEDRGAWIAMEFLDGESLRQRLARSRLTIEEALRIAVEAARGLAAAHDAGIVHRDIKPANVMITQSGIVKLLDFGLAKLLAIAGGESESCTPTITSSGLTAPQTIIGTLSYMSPEQAEGRAVDARSDVFSFGAMLYEMLTGKRAFQGATNISVISAILKDNPVPVRSLRPEVDAQLEAIVHRCLAKDADARYGSAQELLRDLEALLDRDARSARPRWLQNPALIASLCVLLALIVVLGVWIVRQNARERWARREALPEIERLSETDDQLGAFRLAERVRPILAGDPVFEKLWLSLTDGQTISIGSDPAGGRVSMRPYSEPNGPWQDLGETPTKPVNLPRVFSCFRIEKPGYALVELAFSPLRLARQARFRLIPTSAAPAGMTLVPGSTFKFHSAPEVELDEFWLDRCEVTNREFAQFVSAGGYSRPELWKHPFVHQGKTLSVEEAMSLFRDRTGRPGPSTWELGTFPEGRSEFPVSGVSWYEAAAYAEFAGKSLPTIFHWYRAADLTRFSDVLSFSNFNDQGPRAVGIQPSLTTYGNYDMAGNVREWVWNSDGERRYTLGGAWSDPTYLYTGPDALDPMDRSAILGVRCARYEKPPSEACLHEVRDVVRDLTKARPADDSVFQIYEKFFDYDHVDPKGRVESVDDRLPYWRAEKVSFAAAYGEERVPAWLYLPKNASPPYQTIVYFPPASALMLPSIDRVGGREFAFLLRSGRAVLFPVYQDTYERRREPSSGAHFLREVTTQRVLDVRRAIDYLETREDVDHTRIAFYGLSMGAEEGTIAGAVEPRLRTLVLVAAGLEEDMPTEVDGLHFAPRVRMPVLMINGRYDFHAPYETNQQPLFSLFGTDSKDKRHAVFDSGHVPPWPDVVRETLDWLDRYLGPVAMRHN